MDLEGTGVSIQEAMSIVCIVLYTITKLDQRAPEAAMILASLSWHDQELPVIWSIMPLCAMLNVHYKIPCTRVLGGEVYTA